MRFELVGTWKVGICHLERVKKRNEDFITLFRSTQMSIAYWINVEYHTTQERRPLRSWVKNKMRTGILTTIPELFKQRNEQPLSGPTVKPFSRSDARPQLPLHV
jgi:hypothetical protein